jgi:IS30 family transposase
VPGHWEGDLILGTNCRSAIGTLVERSTRFVILVPLLNGHSALEVRDALIAAIHTLPEQLRRSLTWDRGTEMAVTATSLSRPIWQSTSPTRTAPGNAAATRTPTACYASTSPRAPTCPSTPPSTSTTSPPNSTPDPAAPSAASLPLRPWNAYCQLRPPLRRPPETADRPAGRRCACPGRFQSPRVPPVPARRAQIGSPGADDQ